jgi:hypothetical protein
MRILGAATRPVSQLCGQIRGELGLVRRGLRWWRVGSNACGGGGRRPDAGTEGGNWQGHAQVVVQRWCSTMGVARPSSAYSGLGAWRELMSPTDAWIILQPLEAGTATC